MDINFDPQSKPGQRLREDGDAHKRACGREEVFVQLSKRDITQLLLDFIVGVKCPAEIKSFIDGYFERRRRLNEIK